MAGDGLAHDPGADQLADADAGQRIVVCDHRKPTLLLAHQSVDQALGGAHTQRPIITLAPSGMSSTAACREMVRMTAYCAVEPLAD